MLRFVQVVVPPDKESLVVTALESDLDASGIGQCPPQASSPSSLVNPHA
jgi:hypothetical protein